MKLGRPELPDDEKQAKITAVRLREDERDLIENAAQGKSQKLSEWMRDVLISSARRQLKAG